MTSKKESRLYDIAISTPWSGCHAINLLIVAQHTYAASLANSTGSTIDGCHSRAC
jgi:hypothetical protein